MATRAELIDRLRHICLGIEPISNEEQVRPHVKLASRFILEIPIADQTIQTMVQNTQEPASIWELDTKMEKGAQQFLGTLTDEFKNNVLSRIMYCGNHFDSQADPRPLFFKMKSGVLQRYQRDHIYWMCERKQGNYQLDAVALEKLGFIPPQIISSLKSLTDIYPSEKKFKKELKDVIGKEDSEVYWAPILRFALNQFPEIEIRSIDFIPFRSGIGFLSICIQTRRQIFTSTVHVGTAANFNFYARSLSVPKKGTTFPLRRFYKQDKNTHVYEDTYLSNLFNWSYRSLLKPSSSSICPVVNEFSEVEIPLRKKYEKALCYSYVGIASTETEWDRDEGVQEARSFLRQISSFSEGNIKKKDLGHALEGVQLSEYNWHQRGQVLVASNSVVFNSTTLPKNFLTPYYLLYLIARQSYTGNPPINAADIDWNSLSDQDARNHYAFECARYFNKNRKVKITHSSFSESVPAVKSTDHAKVQLEPSAQVVDPSEKLREPSPEGFLMWAGIPKITLTIVFANVIGSKAIRKELGTSIVEERLDAYFKLARALTAEKEGYEIRKNEDELTIAFRTPGDGLDFALALYAKSNLSQLKVRAGIHVGSVETNKENLCSTTINYAVQIGQYSNKGGVWTSDRIERQIQDQGMHHHQYLLWNSHAHCRIKKFHGTHRLWSLRKPIDIVSLSKYEKQWLAKAVTGMICADGRVDPKEIRFLKEVISFLGNQKDINDLLAMVQKRKIPNLTEISTNSKQSIEILKLLAAISIADGRLSPSEVTFFKKVGNLMKVPETILHKIMIKSRQHMESQKLHAQLTTNDKTEDIPIWELSEEVCIFRFSRHLFQKERLVLRFYNQNSESIEDEFYRPVAASVIKVSPDDLDFDSYIIKAEFQHSFNATHGVLQILFPERYKPVEKKLKPSNNSLTGKYVHCYACNQSEIPFWILRSDSMQTKTNIFGTQTYVKPVLGKDHCDFNLLQIVVCPNCYFSTNDIQLFRSEKTKPAPFDVRSFVKVWKNHISGNKEKIQLDPDGFFSEHRTLDQAIVAYELSINAYQILAEQEKEHQYTRKIVTLLLFQAELLMVNEERQAAEENLQKVLSLLEPISSDLKGEAGIRSAMVMSLINTYFKEYQKVGQHIRFLESFANSPDTVSYQKAMDTVWNAYKNRMIYGRDKLKNFHL
jgi:class 3 adenylate cyclase/uncharacterized tellurite resistance protein B-like protein